MTIYIFGKYRKRFFTIDFRTVKFKNEKRHFAKNTRTVSYLTQIYICDFLVLILTSECCFVKMRQ